MGAAASRWGDLWVRNEWEWSRYNFEEADVAAAVRDVQDLGGRGAAPARPGLVMPGYDAVIKCSHLFNLLDARGAISVSERVGYIGRVRKLARAGRAWPTSKQREELGYPLIKDAAERARWIKPTDEAAARGAQREAASPARRGGAREPRPAVRDRRRGAAGRLHRRRRWSSSSAGSRDGLDELRLAHGDVATYATPRRLAVRGRRARRAPGRLRGGGAWARAAKVAFDAEGQPDQGAARLLRGQGRRRRRPCAGSSTPRASTSRVTVQHVGQAAAEVLPALLARGRARAASSPRPCAGRRDAPTCRFAPPGALARGAARRARWCRCGRSGSTAGRASVRAPLPAPGRGRRSRRRADYVAALERVGVVADHRARALARDRRAGRHAGRSRRGGQRGRRRRAGRDQQLPGRVADRAHRRVRRALPRPAARGHRHRAARAPALLRGRGRRRDAAAGVHRACATATSAGSTGVRKGNEDVLVARLDDARFYWDTDLKHAPAERVERAVERRVDGRAGLAAREGARGSRRSAAGSPSGWRRGAQTAARARGAARARPTCWAR